MLLPEVTLSVNVCTEQWLDVQGVMPSKQEALDLSAILHSADNKLRQPVGLEQQLLEHLSMDEEVGQSMVQLLQVRDIARRRRRRVEHALASQQG